MSDKASDTGVIETILERLNDYRLPRLLELRRESARGGDNRQRHAAAGTGDGGRPRDSSCD